MNLSVKGLLFDYGGTIDTNGVHWGEVIWQAFVEFKIPVSYNRFRDAYIHVERVLGDEPLILPHFTFRQTLEMKVKFQFEALGLTDFVAAKKIADFCYENTVNFTRQASTVLAQLNTRYPMLLVSNFYGNLRTVLNEFGLMPYFQDIIESAEVGIRKPDPRLYEIGLQKLGLQATEVAIIGDSYKNDIQPANQLGCPSIWLKVAGWNGQEKDLTHPFIIQNFNDLPDLL